MASAVVASPVSIDHAMAARYSRWSASTRSSAVRGPAAPSDPGCLAPASGSGVRDALAAPPPDPTRPAVPRRTRGWSPASGSASRRRHASRRRTRLLSTSDERPSRTSTPGVGAHRLDGLQVHGTSEHGAAPEQVAIERLQQVVAPADGAAQRLLPRRQVARRHRPAATGDAPAGPASRPVTAA